MTPRLRAALTDRVRAYGSHHTLRCLALAMRSIPVCNEQVLLHSAPSFCCIFIRGDIRPGVVTVTQQTGAKLMCLRGDGSAQGLHSPEDAVFDMVSFH